MAQHLHRGDLPPGLTFGDAVAIDTETMGLNPHRDRLCLVQLSRGDGDCHLVQLPPGEPIDAPNLAALLADGTVLKIFHFARFDIAVLEHALGVCCGPVYCTKIASRLRAPSPTATASRTSAATCSASRYPSSSSRRTGARTRSPRASSSTPRTTCFTCMR